MRIQSTWGWLTVGCLVVSLAAGCSSSNETSDATPTASLNASANSASSGESQPGSVPTAKASPVSLTAGPSRDDSPVRPPRNMFPQVLIKTSAGDIVVKLNAEKSPRTVENFLENYVDSGFYDATVFHYVEKGFMIAGGGYTAELQPKAVRVELFNEAHNQLKNVRGTIAMARRPDAIDSATSQFFFNLVDNPALDHRSDESADTYGYCVFGEVISGMEVLDRIAQVEVADREVVRPTLGSLADEPAAANAASSTVLFPSTPVKPAVVESIRRQR